MEFEIIQKRNVNVKYLRAEIGVRYWEDADINGVEDTDGTLIPCRNDKYWCPVIDLDNGHIINWQNGKEANIHYKSCDDNTFILMDGGFETVAKKDGYVIDMMDTSGKGYGDYVIMHIDTDGYIKDFNPDLHEFQNNEE